MIKALGCGIEVSEFELQSRYDAHFRTDTLGKGMKPPYPPSYGLNSTTTVYFEGRIWHKKVDMPLNKETKPKAVNMLGFLLL